MKISHSIDDNGQYQLKVGATVLGLVRKTVDGFYAELFYGDCAERSSMADLKLWAADIVGTFQGLGERKQPAYYITVDDARKIGGLSHSQITTRVKELYKFHPYLRKEQYGAAILKEAMEAQARWPNIPGYKDAVKWLADNADKLPKMRVVDWEASERQRRPVYAD